MQHCRAVDAYLWYLRSRSQENVRAWAAGLIWPVGMVPEYWSISIRASFYIQVWHFAHDATMRMRSTPPRCVVGRWLSCIDPSATTSKCGKFVYACPSLHTRVTFLMYSLLSGLSEGVKLYILAMKRGRETSPSLPSESSCSSINSG